MTPPESPRPAATRRAPRRGRRSLATAQPGPLGEDILLARHGDRIESFRQDARTNRTVAALRDGGMDSAPNHLDGGAVRLSPVDRTQLRLATLSSARGAETRRELRFLGRITLAWLVVSAIAFGAMMWGAAAMDPQDLQMVMSSQLGAERLPEGIVPPVSG
ncbi:hypothetical protein E7744_13065 [Citricoccus sp. SGAir0253]|uniref:hypothetical protein n=1 Tax=Citricoccus sp. SGAir0253 TaxID=2567881 RepID=UPI0010CCC0CA|nr:hypothetical protein [Citricoccus sp. SGAir0253]QCU78954.1 hypothetical protein E7744_13065 [Citricoccus sp. SGAir0253]